MDQSHHHDPDYDDDEDYGDPILHMSGGGSSGGGGGGGGGSLSQGSSNADLSATTNLNTMMTSIGMPDTPDARAEYESMMLKRKRVPQACDTCNRRKTRCDGTKPVCNNCSRNGHSCSYQRSSRKRGPRAGYIESLENRLKEMEALLRPYESQDLTVNSPGSLGNVHSPSSGSLTSGQSPVFMMNRPFSGSNSIPNDALLELVDIFFHFVYPCVPVIHKASFMANFMNESPLLLNSMYALAARFSGHSSIRINPEAMYSAGDVFYVKARQLVDHYMDVPTTSTVTALLLLATYAAGSGRGSAAWMYSGMAIRMAQELKLNMEPELEESLSNENLTWLEKETRRRLWWSCFIIDRYAGAAADRSMIINEKDCNVYLPSHESLWTSVTILSPEPKGTIPPNDNMLIAVVTSTAPFTPGVPNQNQFSYFILLTKIFGKVVEYANLFKPAQKPGGSGTAPGGESFSSAGSFLAATIQDQNLAAKIANSDYLLSVLNASLQNWLVSLPESMKSFGYEFSNDMVSEYPPSWNVPFLHIFYHTCLILLHRPKMMLAFHTGPLSSVQFDPSFIVCRSSATEVAGIVEKVRASNPSFFYMSPFLAFCIFQAGLIHVMAGHLSGTSAVVEESIRYAELHVNALEGVSRYWFMAGRLHMILRNFMETARTATGGTGSSKPSAGSTSGSSNVTSPMADQMNQHQQHQHAVPSMAARGNSTNMVPGRPSAGVAAAGSVPILPRPPLGQFTPNTRTIQLPPGYAPPASSDPATESTLLFRAPVLPSVLANAGGNVGVPMMHQPPQGKPQPMQQQQQQQQQHLHQQHQHQQQQQHHPMQQLSFSQHPAQQSAMFPNMAAFGTTHGIPFGGPQDPTSAMGLDQFWLMGGPSSGVTGDDGFGSLMAGGALKPQIGNEFLMDFLQNPGGGSGSGTGGGSGNP